MRILLTLLAIGLGGVVQAATPAPAAEETVRAAIVAAIQARMGTGVSVAFDHVLIRGVLDTTRVAAIPDAAARVGGPMRWLLVDAGSPGQARRVGSADTRLTVSAAHVVARRPIPRRAPIAAGDVEEVVGDVGRAVLQPLPRLDQVVGSAARRDLRAGDRVTGPAIVRPDLVRSGDEVTTIARVGLVEVRSRARAAEAGALGEAVRVVVNRRTLRARVVGEREVEVMP